MAAVEAEAIELPLGRTLLEDALRLSQDEAVDGVESRFRAREGRSLVCKAVRPNALISWLSRFGTERALDTDDEGWKSYGSFSGSRSKKSYPPLSTSR